MSKIKDAKKANFELKKFKLVKGTAVASYKYLHDEKEVHEKRIYDVKIPGKPHIDLVSLYNQLREYVCREFYIEPSAENLTLVDVTSVSIDNRLCVINANFNTLHGGVISLLTSKINLDDNESGLEEEIDAIVDAINDEVFQYLFKDKRADPELFSEVAEETPESGLNLPKLQKVG